MDIRCELWMLCERQDPRKGGKEGSGGEGGRGREGGRRREGREGNGGGEEGGGREGHRWGMLQPCQAVSAVDVVEPYLLQSSPGLPCKPLSCARPASVGYRCCGQKAWYLPRRWSDPIT
jgi:hypothetical protein